MSIAELIEVHDGHIQSISVFPGQSVQLEFDRLMVYYPVAIEKYEIWVQGATLALHGVTRLVLEGSISTPHYVDDAIVSRGDDALSEWTRLLEPTTVTHLTLSFGCGARLEVDCSRAYLILSERIRLLEEWEGPL